MFKNPLSGFINVQGNWKSFAKSGRRFYSDVGDGSRFLHVTESDLDGLRR